MVTVRGGGARSVLLQGAAAPTSSKVQGTSLTTGLH